MPDKINYSKRLQALENAALKLHKDFVELTKNGGSKDAGKTTWTLEYQLWYSEAYMVVQQILPHRLEEFVQAYEKDTKLDTLSVQTYNIGHWLDSIAVTNTLTGEKVFDEVGPVTDRLVTQFSIFMAAFRLFDGHLSDVRAIVRADLFDGETDAAWELYRNGFLRAAGTISGVVLEKHLSGIAQHHKANVHKASPSINDYNEALKSGGVVDVPTWRKIQHLSDLRNLCAHSKDREPTKDEVAELIDGVAKITKTLF